MTSHLSVFDRVNFCTSKSRERDSRREYIVNPKFQSVLNGFDGTGSH